MKPITKLRTESGITLFYNNQNNTLCEEDGSIIKFGPEKDYSEYIEFAKQNYNTRKKSKSPAALRILMGHACNYSCTYCMQKDIGNPDELPKNKNLEKFFESIDNNLDLTKLSRVEMWGGEPFLYWNDMMEIMNKFDSPNMLFSIVTNGSALSPKHAEYLGNLQGSVTINISHDAKKQLELRGEEIFDRPRVIKTLQMFDDLPNVIYSFTCSVTNSNFDLFEINDFFRNQIIDNNLKTWNLNFSLGRTYQEGSGSDFDYLPCSIFEPTEKSSSKSESYKHVIHGDNLEKFREVLSKFLDAHYDQYTKYGIINDEPGFYHINKLELPLLLCDIYEAEIGYSVVEYSRKLITGEPILETTNCGADMADIISLDMNGEVRTCPHAGEEHIYGNLNQLKGIRIVSLDLKRKETHCTNCVNIKLCRSSCPIKFPDETFLTNCRVEKIWFGEIQKAAFKFLFNEKVEVVEYELESIKSL